MRVLRQLYEETAKTATGSDSADNRPGKDVSEADGPIELYVNVTAVSNSPTLTITVDDGADEAKFVTSAFGPFPSTGSLSAVGTFGPYTIADFGRYLRFRWSIGGGPSPSITFGIYAVYKTSD